MMMASRRPAAQAERLKRPPLSEIAFSGHVMPRATLLAKDRRRTRVHPILPLVFLPPHRSPLFFRIVRRPPLCTFGV